MEEASGKCVILSAPSGAGKTTIVKHLLNRVPALQFSVSATSRSARQGETDGKDYYFISPDAFRQKVSNGDFLEWEEVYPGQYYGTLKEEVQRIWKQGGTVIFDLDVEGGAKLKAYFAEKALAIFVQPPSIEALEQRLRNRGTESEESLRTRIAKARYELSFSPRFDKVVINEHLDSACQEALDITNAFIKA